MITGNEPIQALYGADGTLYNPSDKVGMAWLNQTQPFIGLTIRQHFAAMLTAAYLQANSDNEDEDFARTIANATVIGVQAADALIEQLNK